MNNIDVRASLLFSLSKRVDGMALSQACAPWLAQEERRTRSDWLRGLKGACRWANVVAAISCVTTR
jgi:hypothetical protein